MVKKRKKIYVLDTSVILYSHDSIMNFEENDIGIPITVLEELDHMKKGNDTLNFEAREFIRMIDKLSNEKIYFFLVVHYVLDNFNNDCCRWFNKTY